jgi:outer membrane protein assembly factor BamB
VRKLGLVLVLVVSLLLVQFCKVTDSPVGANSSTESPNVTQLWRFFTNGSVYDSTVVNNGKVYAISSFIYISVSHLYCLDASTGVEVWNFTIDGYYYSSPVLFGDSVYIVSMRDPTLYALDSLTGDEKWKFMTHSEHAGLPVFADDRIFLTGNNDLFTNFAEDGTVYCLDHTGELVWNHTLPGTIGYPTISGNRVFVNYHHDPTVVDFPPIDAGGIYALDASTGDVLWNYSLGSPVEVPVAANGVVYVGTIDYGDKYPFDNITYPASALAFNASTGEKLWNYTIGEWVRPHLVDNGIFYASANNSNLYALDALSGKKLWNRVLGDPLSIEPLIINGSLYAGYSGRMSCFDAATGAQKWVYETEGDRVSPPVFADNQIYVGSNGPQYFAKVLRHNVYSLNAFTGAEIWRYEIEGNADSITVADGIIYVSAPYVTEESIDFEGNGSVYALKPTNVTTPSPPTPVFNELLFASIISAVVVVIFLAVLLVYLKRRKTTSGVT